MKMVDESEEILIKKMLRDEQMNKLEAGLSMVAHDIQSPIAQVKGLLELALLKSDNNRELREILEKAIESNGRLQGKVEDILKRTGSFNSDIEEVDFRAIIEKAKESLEGVDGYKNTKFITRVEDDLHYWGDTVRLQSVFQNLIENAIKYRNPKADHNIIIFSVCRREMGIIAKITDNGIGIKKELIPFIFEKDFRVSDTNDGHGMGLYLVKKNLNAMGGYLEVESKEGEGTTFTIKLTDNQVIKKNADPLS
nr:HAMP domain-containing sensor histidine kinase [Fulvivirga aurantia]